MPRQSGMARYSNKSMKQAESTMRSNLMEIRKKLEIEAIENPLIIDIKGFVVIEVTSSLDDKQLKGLIAEETGLFYRDYRIFRDDVLVGVSEKWFQRPGYITVIPNLKKPDYLTVLPNYWPIIVHNASANDACGSSSDHKSDEVENEKEAKEPNVSIEKQAEIEKMAQKEEETKKLHELFITDTFESIRKQFKRKQRQKAFPYTKCMLSGDLRKLSLYNELNEKQVLKSLSDLRRLEYTNLFNGNCNEYQYFHDLRCSFLDDKGFVKYTVKDNLSKECPLKYYLQFGIV